MATTKLPYTEDPYKIPGYTGYIQGLQETYKKTPVQAQDETVNPPTESFVHTRTRVPPQTSYGTVLRDPCNNPDNFKKPQPDNLWPNLQEKAIQPSFKPPVSNLVFGDERIIPFKTSYGVDFKAPLRGHEQLRSPNRNEDLVHTTSSLVDIYKSSFNRVGEKRLQKMISTMRERMEAKLGNSNNNAFKMRRLFKMYDQTNTGRVHFEDFRNMCETFGMQLDDDSLMALYYVYDPQGTGYLEYESLVAQLMSPSDFAFYLGYVDNSQNAEDDKRRNVVLNQLATKMVPLISELRKVLAAFDGKGGSAGHVSREHILSGCAAMGVVLSEKELATLGPLFVTNDEGLIHTESFLSIFTGGSASH